MSDNTLYLKKAELFVLHVLTEFKNLWWHHTCINKMTAYLDFIKNVLLDA